MPLFRIRLELARTREFPEGSSSHGYELVAPLDATGHLDIEGWRGAKDGCVVRRFWVGEDDEAGKLVHSHRRWAFSYRPGDDDDEPIFKLEHHRFRVGEYISITEHDGVTRPFRVASVTPVRN